VADVAAMNRRERRRREVLAAASEAVRERGLDGLTMQAIADRLDCAVGTIYTYFPSKSALLAGMMSDAVQLLLDTYRSASSRWDQQLSGTAPDVAAIARILAFTDLFVSAQRIHPDEFQFLQMLITTPESLIDPNDVASVLPSSLAFLAGVHDLIDGAVDAGALEPPTGEDDGLRRTLRWTGAIHGSLLIANVAHVSGLPHADAYDSTVLARQVTADLLRAWGATAATVRAASTAALLLSTPPEQVPVPTGVRVDARPTDRP